MGTVAAAYKTLCSWPSVRLAAGSQSQFVACIGWPCHLLASHSTRQSTHPACTVQVSDGDVGTWGRGLQCARHCVLGCMSGLQHIAKAHLLRVHARDGWLCQLHL